MQDTRRVVSGRGRLAILIKVFFTVLCLLAAFLLVPIKSLSTAVAKADWLFLGLAFLLVPIAVWLRAVRWHFIIRRRMPIAFAIVLRATLIGHALNLILPATLGDVARSYYAWRESGNKEVMLASSIVDKVLALFTLCVIGMICAAVIGMTTLAIVLLAITCSFAVLVFLPQTLPWRWMASLGTRLLGRTIYPSELEATFRMDVITLAYSIWLSVLGWLVTNMIYYCAWMAFDSNTPLLFTFAVSPLINIMRIVPISVSGLGSADLLILFLMRLTAISDSAALLGSVVVNVLLIILPGVVGALFMMAAPNRVATPRQKRGKLREYI